jgi:SpoVK/Ycf46/Vps4 family AAA+-type ATPase
MLTQMERFEGVFIASTNLVEGLDSATLRRFDLKVKFDFMRPQQSVDMFTQHCKRFALRSGIKQAAESVRALNILTPGDFAALSRAHRFKPFATAQELAAALERECQMKPQQVGRRIGF